MTLIFKNRLLRQALHYAAVGWPVFPVYEAIRGRCACGDPKCARPGKHPRTSNGVKDATTDPQIIQGWWRQAPHANIGIATGAKADLWVLDIDGAVGETSLKKMTDEHGALSTATVRTPRGWHYYFTTSGRRIRNSAGKLGAGIDVRGDGGYIIAAGSVHLTGRSYRVVPSSLRAGLFEPLPAPQWLLDKVAEPEGVPPPQQGQVADRTSERAHTYSDAAVQQELERLQKTPTGQRNDALNRCAFKLGQLVAAGSLNRDTVFQN